MFMCVGVNFLTTRRCGSRIWGGGRGGGTSEILLTSHSGVAAAAKFLIQLYVFELNRVFHTSTFQPLMPIP